MVSPPTPAELHFRASELRELAALQKDSLSTESVFLGLGLIGFRGLGLRVLGLVAFVVLHEKFFREVDQGHRVLRVFFGLSKQRLEPPRKLFMQQFTGQGLGFRVLGLGLGLGSRV